jgi:uncharacterized protein
VIPGAANVWPVGRRLAWWVGLLALVAALQAAEVIPRAPANHFTDAAQLVRPATATQLNQELAQFERETSNQILVAIYPRMQSGSSVDDYTVRVAQSWRVGQKGRNNGAVLFVFKQSRDVRIVTGYGLEGALPDALCKRIIENEIVPRFRAGDFDGGLVAGVRAMIAATKGEYRGTGRTVADARGGGGGLPLPWPIVLFVVIVLLLRAASRRGSVYAGRGRRTVWMGRGPWGGSGGWGGGGWSGGRGGGTFSGGGGSFGGGGAGGKW